MSYKDIRVITIYFGCTQYMASHTDFASLQEYPRYSDRQYVHAFRRCNGSCLEYLSARAQCALTSPLPRVRNRLQFCTNTLQTLRPSIYSSVRYATTSMRSHVHPNLFPVTTKLVEGLTVPRRLSTLNPNVRYNSQSRVRHQRYKGRRRIQSEDPFPSAAFKGSARHIV